MTAVVRAHIGDVAADTFRDMLAYLYSPWHSHNVQFDGARESFQFGLSLRCQLSIAQEEEVDRCMLKRIKRDVDLIGLLAIARQHRAAHLAFLEHFIATNFLELKQCVDWELAPPDVVATAEANQ